MKPSTAKNVSHKNNWNQVAVQVHVHPPLIPLNKSNNDDKLDRYCVKNKLRRDPMSENLDFYEFKMTFLDNSSLEEFLLLIRNFQMTLDASGRLTAGMNVRYLRTLLRGEALRQLGTLSIEVGSTTSEHLKLITLVLGT